MNISTALARRPLVRYLAAAVGCAIGGGIGAGVAVGFGSTSPVGLLIAAVGGTVGMLIAIWATLMWWNTLDEAAREAHKWAWWWGSNGGIAFGGIAAITLFSTARGGQALASLGSDPVDLLLLGGFICAMFQVFGYALAWAGWWLARR